jgi:DNA polymerase-3 subunit gamma/tau
MSYQVIARKWRPQKFDDVVGQNAVTRTLRNALASKRLAQAFVFAGPRGVGKTTTARILARALNCVDGPTPDPCGVCEACVEIAEGRDMDVLEIDAATHTGIDNVREVIISGLGIMPVRDRYKVFIIDEVHQLSPQSFNALLKSIEEPPAHVVFMMATTEFDKIPETILSRSQVYEFRTISGKAISDKLRSIVDAMEIEVGDDSLLLIARDAEGSMRDAQSKLDQVIAFTGKTIGPGDVATVLGLVGRDLLLDAVEAVAGENAPAAFVLAGRAVEMGYDLRAVCRELARTVRDLLVLSVDPSRISDPEIAGEGDRDRLMALVQRFSREDLLRAFDLLARAEADIRSAAQPRYHLEMALLRWIHLRKLVSIEDLIAGTANVASGTRGAVAPGKPGPLASVKAAPAAQSAALGEPAPAGNSAAIGKSPVASGFSRTSSGTSPIAPRPASGLVSAAAAATAAVASRMSALSAAAAPSRDVVPSAGGEPAFKDAFLAEIRKGKAVLYNMVLVQAQKIEAAGDRVTFTFSASQRALRDTFEQNRAWLESLAQKTSGRKIIVAAVLQDAVADPPAGEAAPPDKKAELRKQAMADAGVQAMLEVFPAEIRDIEEI